ncbi:arginine-glutamic acid dipeptide repeats protein [Sebastes umbrosus]|uniref:arginine-glutamic acid dipeptide repeats protein n=1 Tax=Sebastes umbrosus TaxID=72105 RepID=UPI00189D471C|nr:arginine-glutamic acid dipeptide repeats protein [Sebastes umbrosus]
MSPLFMEAGYELNSPGSGSGSVSAEGSNTGGSEREGEGQPKTNRGRRRQEKNRDAARKSRRKQTERADELHEELQGLEQSNSALKKEIAALKKDLQLYTTALEQHKPLCCLKDSTHLSTSADCQSSSSPPGAHPQASSSTFAAAAPSLSTSLTSSPGLQTRDCVESAHPAFSAPPTTTTSASPSGSPAKLFSVTAPMSFSTAPAPHSLFSEDPPPLITSNVPPVCTGLASNPSSSLAAAAPPRPGQGTIHESSSMSANARFSPIDEFLMTPASFLTASLNVAPLYSRLAVEYAGLVAPGCPMNEAQLHPGQFSRNSTNSSPPCSLLPATLQDPALQGPSVPSPASAFEPSYNRQVNRVSLLSMLTVPSPLNVSPTTSSSFDGPPPQPPPSLPLLGDTSRDLSLSELLEGNDWILSGTGSQ